MTATPISDDLRHRIAEISQSPSVAPAAPPTPLTDELLSRFSMLSLQSQEKQPEVSRTLEFGNSSRSASTPPGKKSIGFQKPMLPKRLETDENKNFPNVIKAISESMKTKCEKVAVNEGGSTIVLAKTKTKTAKNVSEITMSPVRRSLRLMKTTPQHSPRSKSVDVSDALTYRPNSYIESPHRRLDLLEEDKA